MDDPMRNQKQKIPLLGWHRSAHTSEKTPLVDRALNLLLKKKSEKEKEKERKANRQSLTILFSRLR
tara:strand:- start:351 stop:548 length:198 start_codon:yes stop_codon:yes gene_type:complete